MVSSISKSWTLCLSLILTSSVLPSLALACAVCSAEEKESVRQAYSYSTAWLSVVPLIFMGGVGGYIYNRVKRGKNEE